MPIHPLPVMTEEEERKAIDQLKPPESVVVRYGYMKQVGEFRYGGDQVLGCGTKLVCRTPRGVELAEMLTTTCANGGCGHSITRKQMLDYIDQSGGKQYPFSNDGKVLRIATPDDLMEQSKIDTEKPRYIGDCKAMIKKLNLEMKLVDCELLLGGERVIYYFTSESRVDFRELVRELAGELHTRIEMRQVGARDEARIVADYEKCGQQCCCKQFLKVLKPVSMRNAKIQKATLDPSKISGRCGRLMCCLRYEEVTYDELRKRLPYRNSRVMTDDGLGTVCNTQILTQLVLVELDSTHQRAAYPVENIRNVSKEEEQEIVAKAEEERKAAAEAREKERASRRRSRKRSGGEQQGGKPDSGQGRNESNAQASGDEQGGGKKKRRRRRRRRRRGGGGDKSGGDGGSGGGNSGGGGGDSGGGA
jgi:cell fate regulator YaaT (PSP1 superfamily)